MTKTTLLTVAAILNSLTLTSETDVAARDAVNAEVAKGEAKAQVNRDLYASAHEAVFAVICDTPMTVAEIYEACASELPEGFSKSKVQWGLTNQWRDEVVKHENGKKPYTYTKA
jgi:transcriptional regulator